MMKAASGLGGKMAVGAGLVSIIIPARDESAAIPDLVAGLAAQGAPSAADEAVQAGFILAPDAELMKTAAAEP